MNKRQFLRKINKDLKDIYQRLMLKCDATQISADLIKVVRILAENGIDPQQEVIGGKLNPFVLYAVSGLEALNKAKEKRFFHNGANTEGHMKMPEYKRAYAEKIKDENKDLP